jgi:hypothetical protein
MVRSVIAIHLVLSCGLLWLAWQMWQLRRSFVATVKAVDSWTIACQSGLGDAPAAILKAKQGAKMAKGSYAGIAQQISQIYGILQTVQRIYVRLQPKGKGKYGKR